MGGGGGGGTRRGTGTPGTPCLALPAPVARPRSGTSSGAGPAQPAPRHAPPGAAPHRRPPRREKLAVPPPPHPQMQLHCGAGGGAPPEESSPRGHGWRAARPPSGEGPAEWAQCGARSPGAPRSPLHTGHLFLSRRTTGSKRSQWNSLITRRKENHSQNTSTADNQTQIHPQPPPARKVRMGGRQGDGSTTVLEAEAQAPLRTASA